MKFRFRALAALLVLFALSAILAEGVWASTCAGAGTSGAADHGQMDMGMGDTSSHRETPAPGQSSDSPECPLPAIAAGCIIHLAPAPTIGMTAPALVQELATVARVDRAGRMVGSSHFRPPRQ